MMLIDVQNCLTRSQYAAHPFSPRAERLKVTSGSKAVHGGMITKKIVKNEHLNGDIWL